MRGNKSLRAYVSYFCAIFSLVSLLFLVNIASGCSDRWLVENPAALFVFGDSIFDAGNNNYININNPSNRWPYGETFFGYPTGRSTDGRTIPDFISEYAKLPLILPYLQPDFRDYSYGANFASSGAGALVETHRGRVIDLKTQLSYFNIVEKHLRHKLGSEEEAKAFLSTAVYLLSIGGNDYFNAYHKNFTIFLSPDSLEEYVGMVIGNLTNVIQEVYNKGGRKFGLLNLWHIGCIPAYRASEKERKYGCADELLQAVKIHNKLLSQSLQSLAFDDQLDDFKYSILDFYTSFSQRSDNPSKYGFKEAKMACCGSGPFRGIGSCGRKSSGIAEFELCDDPKDFLYFDSAHPTEKVYEQLAKLFWSGNPDVVGPYNLKSLFGMDKYSCGFEASSSR